MDAHQRRTSLLEVLANQSHATVAELAHELKVSPATVRRDLDELAHQQLLTRTRGGAVAQGVSYALPLRYKAARHGEEKRRIARAAAGLVRRGDSVGLNGGTTATEVARTIALDPALTAGADSERPAVVIVTNAVNIASELCVRPQVRVVLTGGTARPQSFEMIGPLATASLAEVYLDIAFVGVDAFDPDLGAMAAHEGEAAVIRCMIQRADRVVVVTDSSKLGTRALGLIAPTTAIHQLITDSSVDPALVAAFEAKGLRVTLA